MTSSCLVDGTSSTRHQARPITTARPEIMPPPAAAHTEHQDRRLHPRHNRGLDIRQRHCGGEAPVHGLRGPGRQRDQHGAPVLVREKTGHALIGARQWIPREHIEDPVKSLVTGLPLDLRFRTKGQLAIDILRRRQRRRAVVRLRLRGRGLRQLHAAAGVPGGPRAGVRAAGRLDLYDHAGPGNRMTCADAVKKLVKGKRRWEVRSAGKGSKGERWYAWAWIATASPRHTCWSAAT